MRREGTMGERVHGPEVEDEAIILRASPLNGLHE